MTNTFPIMHIQMSSNTNTRAVSLLMKYSRIAGAAAFIGGCVVFAGWIFNIPILMSFQPMSVTMKCNTALAFILTGGCLLLFHRHRKSLANDLMIKVFASVVLILSLLNVAEYISRSDLGIDQVIVYEPPGTPGTYNPGRMAPNTAFCFICLSTAMVLVTIRRKRTIMISQIMGLLSLLMTITALIGFLYSINEFYGFDNLTKMAHYAIILFIILDTGVLCAVPDKGIMDIVCEKEIGGFIVRRLLPAILFVPIFVGWLSLQGTRAGWFSSSLGVLIVAVTYILLIMTLVWKVARSLDTFDIEKKTAQLSLDKSVKENRFLANSIACINESVSITDEKDIIIFVNDAFLSTYGYEREEVIGRHISMLQPKEVITEAKSNILSETMKGSWKGEILNQRKDGTIFPIYLSTSIIKDEKGNPEALIGVAVDISERIRNREELISAKEKAEEISRLKTSLLNNMSHELRTPLIGVMGFAEILQSEIDDPVHKEMLALIHNGGKRLSDTLNLLLELSKIEADRLEIRNKQFNLSEVTRRQAESYEGAARIKGLALSIIIKDDNILANSDENMYSQIVDNLVNNAIKFTVKGKIKVILEKEVNYTEDKTEFNAVLKVVDTGIGLAEENFNLIFEEYRQVSEGLSRNFQGTGLGLTVTKKFVEKLGGTVSVESKLGSGSTFTVILPAINN